MLEAAGTAVCFSLFAARNAAPAELSPDACIIAAVVLVGPLTEEMLYRGGVYAVCKGRFGMLFAAVLSALLFAAAHPGGFPEAALAGGLFCLLMERGGLSAAIAAHVLINGLSFWPGLYTLPRPAYGLGMVGLAGMALWLGFRMRPAGRP